MKPILEDIEILNTITHDIIDVTYQLHSHLGPGLLESVYEACLEYDLRQIGFCVERQKVLPVNYKDVAIDSGYRVDLIVENSIILEIKSVEEVLPVHSAQLMTYLRLSGLKLGLLLNFNVPRMKSGIHRIIM